MLDTFSYNNIFCLKSCSCNVSFLWLNKWNSDKCKYRLSYSLFLIALSHTLGGGMQILSFAFWAAMCSHKAVKCFHCFTMCCLIKVVPYWMGILLHLCVINTDTLKFAESLTYFCAESEKRKWNFFIIQRVSTVFM